MHFPQSASVSNAVELMQIIRVTTMRFQAMHEP